MHGVGIADSLSDCWLPSGHHLVVFVPIKVSISRLIHVELGCGIMTSIVCNSHLQVCVLLTSSLQ